MTMSVIRPIRFTLVLFVAGAMASALPGCGGGADDGAGAGDVDTVIVNPSPESLEPETGEEEL